MTEQTEHDLNRRKMLKKGAVATGIGALASGAMGGTAAAQDGDQGASCRRFLRAACQQFHTALDQYERGNEETAQQLFEQYQASVCRLVTCMCEEYPDSFWCTYRPFYCD